MINTETIEKSIEGMIDDAREKTSQVEALSCKVQMIEALSCKVRMEDIELYSEWMSLYIELKRDIKRLEISLKHEELLLQKHYEEEGVKAIKTREQLARDDFTKIRLLVEDYKQIRDEVGLECELLRFANRL